MVGKHRESAGQTNATLAVLGLALALVAPLVGAGGAALGTASTTSAELQAFADGSVSKTLQLGAGAHGDGSTSLRLPYDATVTQASVDATVAGNSTATSGWLSADLGADGAVESNVTFVSLTTVRLDLGAEAVNAYLRAHGAASTIVEIPLAIKVGVSSGTCVLVLNHLNVNYTASTQADRAPSFQGEVQALAVVAGQANESAVDVAAHFSDAEREHLTFSSDVAVDGQSAAAGVTVSMNGSRVDLRSANANWWGEVAVRFAAADTLGQVALSNEVKVHVIPGEATVATTRTDAHVDARTFTATSCLGQSYQQQFSLPADAVVTGASLRVESGLNLTALGLTVDVFAGAEALASVDGSKLPAQIELNASGLNAELHAEQSAWGLVVADIGVKACPIGGLAEVKVSNVSVTYTRGPSNGSASAGPIIAAIEVNGNVSGTVEGSDLVTLEAQTQQPLPPDAKIDWYIDGNLVGSGQVVTNVALGYGNHTVEARAETTTAAHAFVTQVRATARPLVGAAIAFGGEVTSSVKSDTAVAVELRTAKPLQAGARVDWYVDGKFVGGGSVLANVSFTPGVHTIEARSSANGTVETYSTQVEAFAGAPPLESLGAALAASAGVVAGVAGPVLWRRRSRQK